MTPLNSVMVGHVLDEVRQDVLNILARSERPLDQRFVWICVLNPKEDGAETILGARLFGKAPEKHEDWKRPYNRFAEGKARTSRESGLDSGVVRYLRPATLSYLSCYLPGGVCLGGIPVGTSGVESYLDEEISRLVAARIDSHLKKLIAHLESLEEYVLQ